MKHWLVRLLALPRTDHRAVFSAFAEALLGTLRRRGGEARVRVVRG